MTRHIVRQIHSPSELWPYCASMLALLEIHHNVLLEDAQRSGSPTLDAQRLLDNIATYPPWLWLLMDENKNVRAIAALSDIQPGRHGFIHGISHPHFRKNGGLDGGIDRAFFHLAEAAFGTLKFAEIRAEFEADNCGAKGFCFRLGFQRQALLKQEIKINGQQKDALIYSLSEKNYQHRTRPILLRRSQRAFSINPPYHHQQHKEPEPCH